MYPRLLSLYNNWAATKSLVLYVCLFCFFPVPDNLIVVEISENRPPTLGEYYNLVCHVSGDEVRNSSRTYQWTKTNSTHNDILVKGDSTDNYFQLNNLRLHDAGEYTCRVTISSPFLIETVSRMSSHITRVSSEYRYLHPTYNVDQSTSSVYVVLYHG